MKKHQKAALDAVSEATKKALLMRAMSYVKKAPAHNINTEQEPEQVESEGTPETPYPGTDEVVDGDEKALAGGEQLTEEDIEALRNLLK
jgi:hypothetical protein